MNAHRSLMLAVLFALAPFVAKPVAADPILDFTGGTAEQAPSDATVGWKFTVTGSAITITGLGLFDAGADGLAQSHQIGLWTGTGSVLASATINAGNSTTAVQSTSPDGNWRSTSDMMNATNTPITSLQLNPGDYVVGAFYAKGSPDSVMFGATTSTIKGVTWDEYRGASGPASFPGTFTFEGGGKGFFGPNLFTATTTTATTTPPIPEPTSLILLGSGLAGLAGRIAWRKRRPK